MISSIKISAPPSSASEEMKLTSTASRRRTAPGGAASTSVARLSIRSTEAHGGAELRPRFGRTPKTGERQKNARNDVHELVHELQIEESVDEPGEHRDGGHRRDLAHRTGQCSSGGAQEAGAIDQERSQRDEAARREELQVDVVGLADRREAHTLERPCVELRDGDVRRGASLYVARGRGRVVRVEADLMSDLLAGTGESEKQDREERHQR